MAADDELAAVHQLRPGAAGDDPSAEARLAVVARHVLEGLDDLVPTMGAAYRREVAEYAAMDDESFDHVLRTSAAFVRRFVVALAEGVGEPVPDRAALVASGRTRQRSGISLDAAMHAFRIASRVGWTGIADASTAVAPNLVSDLAGRWIEYADRASTAFAEGHTSSSSEQLRRMDARRQALVADLLAAQDEAAARAVASGHGLTLAESYVPVVLPGDAASDEDHLDASVPPGSIVGRRGGHLVALIPLGAHDLTTLLNRLGTVAHGHAATPGASLAGEVVRAESVLAVARRLGRTGVLGPDALALHRAVHEHDGLQRHLRDAVLAPLIAADPDGIFRETLRAYLADGAVRAVADRLFVHANTVTYRLRRVRECTGLDPRVPHQAASLVLALALADVSATPAAPGLTDAAASATSSTRTTTTTSSTTTDEAQP